MKNKYHSAGKLYGAFSLFRLIVLLLLYGWVTVFSLNPFPAATGSYFQQTSSDELTPAKPRCKVDKLGWQLPGEDSQMLEPNTRQSFYHAIQSTHLYSI